MNKIATIILVLILPSFAFSQQVEFYKGTWQEANELAAKENKFIFVDAYTEWCGWCKVMDKEMFTDSLIAPFINQNFIPVKIDFEDSLGIILAMKFRVWSYPTTLVFNSYGQLTGKFGGYTEDHGKFLDFLKKNREITAEQVYGFDSHELDLPYPDFFIQAFVKGKDRKWPEKETVANYLAGQQDLYSEVNWSILLRFNPAAYRDHVINNLEKYAALYGKVETTDYLQNVIYYNYLRKAIDSSNTLYFEKALQLCDKLENPEEEKIYLKLNYYEGIKDWKSYADAFESYIGLKGYDNHMWINNNCWTIYENAEDKEILEKAVEWMKPVIEAEPIWMYLDTYASLLFKTGNLEEALKYADLAIAAGKQEQQEDISETEKLREKIIQSMTTGK
jgi:thioredoxin-related protein